MDPLHDSGPEATPPPPSSAGRWWVAAPGQQPQGPFDRDTLMAMYRSGRLGAGMSLCPEGDTTWRPVPDVLGAPTVPPIDPSVAMRTFAVAPWAQQSLVLPILATIFCCLIGGIVSIVMTAQANSKGVMGDIAGAQRDARTARTWLIISALTPVAVALLYALFVVAVIIFGTTMAAPRPGPMGGP